MNKKRLNEALKKRRSIFDIEPSSAQRNKQTRISAIKAFDKSLDLNFDTKTETESKNSLKSNSKLSKKAGVKEQIEQLKTDVIPFKPFEPDESNTQIYFTDPDIEKNKPRMLYDDYEPMTPIKSRESASQNEQKYNDYDDDEEINYNDDDEEMNFVNEEEEEQIIQEENEQPVSDEVFYANDDVNYHEEAEIEPLKSNEVISNQSPFARSTDEYSSDDQGVIDIEISKPKRFSLY